MLPEKYLQKFCRETKNDNNLIRFKNKLKGYEDEKRK
jgi:hypothetical protein